jgi:AbrB family looped-hinge helix DNA binding protein
MNAQLPTRLPESTVTSRGQTTLPKQVREALDLKAGDKVRYFIYDGEVRIAPVRPIERLFGILKYDGPPVSLEDIERGIIEGACRSALGDDWSPGTLEEQDRAVAARAGRK